MILAANYVSEGLVSAASEDQSNKGPIPCIADGDTGYGNAINVKRTVAGYARAGMGGIMIEDQVAPKRWVVVAAQIQAGVAPPRAVAAAEVLLPSAEGAAAPPRSPESLRGFCYTR